MKTPLLLGWTLAFLAQISAQPTNTPPSVAPSAPALGQISPPVPLATATLEKIARMPLLFDGKTLDGWIQAPPAPLTFSASEIIDLPALARKLAEKSDAVSAFLNDQLDEPARTSLAAFTPTEASTKELSALLVKNFNRIVAGPSLYDAVKVRNVTVRSATEALRGINPRGQDLMRLNRMLLEDAYSRELTISPTKSWTVKNGAMASMGAGRGVIYTTGDYTHYRLIFTMRHVSGKPDHQPCILIFCTRPEKGKKGLDALGGIQFQVPNGGHWDYRPGKNNAGTAFTNPIKTKYDNHEWHQVEILVNAKDGTAHMAVAQPVGTRAIANLDFNDPAAGKTGPIAWQMHNAGLMDEFKDVRIEVEPKEDWLITVE